MGKEAVRRGYGVILNGKRHLFVDDGHQVNFLKKKKKKKIES